jgi:hypothetical protein
MNLSAGNPHKLSAKVTEDGPGKPSTLIPYLMQASTSL